MKTYPRTCKYCGKKFQANSRYQVLCSPECRSHQHSFDATGLVYCTKCGRKDVIERYSKDRVCKDCKRLLFGRTIDDMSPDELFNYGKVQAQKFMKQRNKEN